MLEAVYHSKSWRITKPFRVAKGGVRSIYRSTFVHLIRAVGDRIAQRIKNLAYSTQTSKAIDAMVEMRTSVNIATLSRYPKEKLEEWPEITVSVVTYNNGHWLKQFMASVLAQDYPLNKIHVVFVDNTSSDQTPKLLARAKEQYGNKFRQFSVISQPNHGFGAGHDLAIRSASTSFVLVSNIDLEFVFNSITRVVISAMQDEVAASWELRQIPYEHPKYVDPITLCVNWSSHACVLLSRERYLEVGGYEKRIFMYGEDVELSYRFRRCGYLIRSDA